MKIVRVILFVIGIAVYIIAAILVTSSDWALPNWLPYLGFVLMLLSAALNWVPNADRKRKADLFESEMQSLIEMLQSSDPDQRYEAGKQLRVSPSISPNALDALRLAAQDENPDVANIAQQAILENQIKQLELHKTLLEKSVPNSTMIVVTIASFGIFFSCVIGIAGISTFIGPSLSEKVSEQPILMFYYIIIAVILTIPTVIYFRNNSKQKDEEALERTNNEIQELEGRLQEIRQTKPAP